jgi:hypothetical protein
MSALANWLERWQPVHIHRALLADARLEDVAGAFGSSLSAMFYRWHDWAASQRIPGIAVKAGMTDGEYRKVMDVFTAAGLASWQ